MNRLPAVLLTILLVSSWLGLVWFFPLSFAVRQSAENRLGHPHCNTSRHYSICDEPYFSEATEQIFAKIWKYIYFGLWVASAIVSGIALGLMVGYATLRVYIRLRYL